MNLLDRYLLQQWLAAFGLAAVATLAVLLLENVQNELGDFIRWNAPAGEVLRFYAAYSLMQLPLILPLALFLSLLFTLGNLHRNHEITAQRAAGRSVLGITRGLWAAGLLLAAGLFALNVEGVPWATRTTRELRDTWRMRAEATEGGVAAAGVVAPLGYANALRNRLWLMNRFSRYTKEGFGVSVYVTDARGRETERVLARKMFFDDAEGHWVGVAGRVLTFDPVSGEAIHQELFDRRSFEGWRETPATMLALNADPARLSLFELQAVLSRAGDADPERTRRFAMRYARGLAAPVDVLLVVAVAIPLAVAGVRRNPWVNLARAGLLMAGYFVVSGIVGLLGEQGHVPITAAVWAPPGLLLAAVLPTYLRLA